MFVFAIYTTYILLYTVCSTLFTCLHLTYNIMYYNEMLLCYIAYYFMVLYYMLLRYSYLIYVMLLLNAICMSMWPWYEIGTFLCLSVYSSLLHILIHLKCNIILYKIIPAHIKHILISIRLLSLFYFSINLECHIILFKIIQVDNCVQKWLKLS